MPHHRKRVRETVHMHVSGTRSHGARIRISGRVARVQGVQQLSGAHVQATDLRASDFTDPCGAFPRRRDGRFTGFTNLDRGYEHIEEKLANLGLIYADKRMRCCESFKAKPCQKGGSYKKDFRNRCACKAIPTVAVRVRFPQRRFFRSHAGSRQETRALRHGNSR